MLAGAILHGIILVGTLFAYGRWLDDETLGEICLYGLFIEFFFSVGFLNYFSFTDAILFLDCGTIQSGITFFTISLILCFDGLSGFFLGILTVALIFCFYFLVEYFEYDAGSSMIISLSALFSQVALLFFCSFDLFLIIFFWEVISIISFLLVQHWSHRIPTYKAGLKVFTISQIGDFPFLIFIFIINARFGTTSLIEILPLIQLVSFEFLAFSGFIFSVTTLLAFLLSMAVFLKSAQFFFYPWLLDAMEAPVPISAQLHSSTLVVIGFYLFYRFQILFMISPAINIIFLWFGLFTVIGASILGFFQVDGKRLLACSTASQLGYIIVSLGLGLYEESLFLLAFCCCNKAFTFVWFGVLMQRHAGLSDFRFIGGSSNLAWFEHAGLAVAIANFTILPGAFSWHVKSLFIQGQTPVSPFGFSFGVEVLQLTWFFSSLYLLYLYIALFLKPIQGKNSTFVNSALKTLQTKSLVKLLLWETKQFCLKIVFKNSTQEVSTSFFFISFLILICLVCPMSFGFIMFTDTSWACGEIFLPLSYY